MKNLGINNKNAAKLNQNGTCMDCIFWYQCKQGKVDCQARQK